MFELEVKHLISFDWNFGYPDSEDSFEVMIPYIHPDSKDFEDIIFKSLQLCNGNSNHTGWFEKLIECSNYSGDLHLSVISSISKTPISVVAKVKPVLYNGVEMFELTSLGRPNSL